jgi:hypothetical protein
MGEITYLLDTMKHNLDSDENFESFKDNNNGDMDSHNDAGNLDNMPATLEELAQIKSS